MGFGQGFDENERKQLEDLQNTFTWQFASPEERARLVNRFIPNFTEDEQARIDAEVERLKAESGRPTFRYKTYRDADGRIVIESRAGAWDPIKTTYLEAEGVDDPALWAVNLNRIPSELRKTPLYPWGRAKPNGLAAAYQVDSMRMVQAIGVLQLRNILEIPLTDDDGLPLIDPAIPPVCEVRVTTSGETPTYPSEDPVDDPKLQYAASVKWTDSNISWPTITDASGANAGYKWSVRMARDPVPHWVFRVAWENTEEAHDFSNSTLFGILVHAIGGGTGSHTGSAGILKEVGTTWTHGHYSVKLNWHEDGNVESGDVINGTVAELNRPKHVVVAESGISSAGGTTSPLYFTTPNALSSDTAIFASDDPPMVTAYIHNSRGTQPTITTETDWLPTTIGGQGSVKAQTWADPPAHSVNTLEWAHQSNLEWSSANSKWFVEGRNFSGFTRNLYFFALGR